MTDTQEGYFVKPYFQHGSQNAAPTPKNRISEKFRKILSRKKIYEGLCALLGAYEAVFHAGKPFFVTAARTKPME